MARFMTRVELHGATAADYDRLHEEMKNVGFSRFIQADDGTWYHLPTAEYHIQRNCTIEDVHDIARLAANRTGKDSSVLVSEYNGLMWSGLTIAKRAGRLV